MEKIDVIERAANRLLQHNVAEARSTIETGYPFHKLTAQGRNYTDKEKMAQFVRDGFIDRYSGQKLVNPGILKVLSYYMPETFPDQAHWKMEECHNAYWEFVPTVDHIYPVALGGADFMDKEFISCYELQRAVMYMQRNSECQKCKSKEDIIALNKKYDNLYAKLPTETYANDFALSHLIEGVMKIK